METANTLGNDPIGVYFQKQKKNHILVTDTNKRHDSYIRSNWDMFSEVQRKKSQVFITKENQ